MNYINKNIRYLRKKRKMTQPQLGELVNKSESTIQMWESGFRSPTMGSVQTLANIFDISINDLMTVDLQNVENENIYSQLEINYIKVPLYDNLCCGNGGFVDDNIIEMIPIPSRGLSPKLRYFAQYAHGKSMIGAGIDEGDLLVFEKADKVNSGVIGCFCLGENKATCKKYKELESLIMLQPMNNDYEPIVIDPLNNNVRCIGKLKKVIKDFEWED